jgi:hypothetical protein
MKTMVSIMATPRHALVPTPRGGTVPSLSSTGGRHAQVHVSGAHGSGRSAISWQCAWLHACSRPHRFVEAARAVTAAPRCSDGQVVHPTTWVGRSRRRVARLIDGGVRMIQFQELVRLPGKRSS